MASVLPEWLTPEGYLCEGRLSTDAVTGDGLTVFTKRVLEESLRTFGEDQLLVLVGQGLTKEQVRSIGVTDARLIHESDPSSKVGNGYHFDKALALAAVEVLEGSRRQLARKRKRSRSQTD
jgi:hypothetical protein